MRAGKLLSAAAVAAVAAAAIPDQAWDYVDVRSGAHLFYWLYGSTGVPRASAPLVFWLQGGPGASSVGYGDFSEMGPLDINLQPRNTTWVQAANVVYIDNPVGTGYSYVDDLSLLTTNVTQIAADLVAFTAAFFEAYPELQANPFYIFSESYGGKMTVAFADALLTAIDNKVVTCNFRGIELGDSWISPIDYVDTWSPWLRMLSVMDSHQFNATVAPVVKTCDDQVAAGQWAAATNTWGDVENVIGDVTDGISWYNVLLHNQPDGVSSTAPSGCTGATSGRAASAALALERGRKRALEVGLSPAALAVKPAGVSEEALLHLYARHVGALRYGDALDTLMNGPIKKQLGIIPANVTWGGQSDAVFSAQSGDFMRPIYDVVDKLLMGGRINITVVQGQLDLICATVGTETWMNRLQWQGLPDFLKSRKLALYSWPGTQETGGFVKTSPDGRLSMYYIMNAGHMLPADNGDMAFKMMKIITGQEKP